jgi:Zn-dependent protease with chaperone function
MNLSNLMSEKELIHPNERRYFWLVATISVLLYISLALSIVGLLIALSFIAVSLFLHALMISMIRSNAVRLSEAQFPEVYAKVKELCEQMGISRVPDVYVMESSGALNAFAARFFGRNMVVLYSEIFELIDRGGHDELAFVIAHELAHIKRNHISKSLFILPAMWIPGLAELYLRACEYTCDRYGAYYTNSEAGKNALTILAVGKQLYKRVNREAYVEQLREEKGFFVWLSEILSSHPPLPKRIAEIERFFAGEASEQRSFTKAALLVAGIFAGIVLIGAGGYYGWTTLSEATWFEEESEQQWASGEILPLVGAIIAGDEQEVRQLIEQDEDVNVIDDQGMTPLHWAAQDGNDAIATLLLQAGADIEAQDEYTGMTPLMTAAQAGQSDMVALLASKGAEVNAQDLDGMTALMYAAMNGHTETVKTLLDLGANPKKADHSGMTALMYAIQSGYRDTVALLRQHERGF